MNAPIAPVRRPLIVHVVRQFLPNRGGLEDVVYNLGRELLSRGFRVRVVTLDRLFSDPGRALPVREEIDGIEVVRIPWKGSSRYPVAPSVLSNIGDADIVHVHAVDFFFDFLSWTQPLHGKPLVATTHGGFFHTENHALIKKVWFRTATRLSTRGYRELVCCSASDTALFSRIAKGRTTTIENGADLSKFAGRASEQPARRMITIGRFSVNKRLDNLIRATERLVVRDSAWHLDIVGVPADLTEADLRALIAEAGLEQNITLHVGIGNSEIGDLMGTCSIFASASDYEGFGLVAIEAMSAGLLPVLNANAAYRQLASRHGTICLTDFSAPEAAANAIDEAYLKVEAGGAALRHALITDTLPYSWKSVADSYVEAYRRAVPSLALPAG